MRRKLSRDRVLSLAAAVTCELLESRRLLTGVSFSENAPIGLNDSYVAVGDFNGDHIPDIIGVNNATGQVDLLIGNGDGTFVPPVMVGSVGNVGVDAIAAGDLNNDGNLDFVTANNSANSVSVVFGNGDGTFKAPQTFTTDSQNGPNALVLADVNGDGYLDIITANKDENAVNILISASATQFDQIQTLSDGGGPFAIAAADINGDGNIDLVTANKYYGTLSVFLGNGDGNFDNRTDYTVGPDPQGVAIGDLNGDGKPDIVVASYANANFAEFLGNGDGTFNPNYNVYGTTYQPTSIAIADTNGDGIPDVITGSGYGDKLTISLGQGGGSFCAPYSYGFGGNAINDLVVADVNGDGVPDVVAATNAVGANINVIYNTSTIPALDAPTLVSPADTQANLEGITQFSWNSAPGATQYRLIIATDRADLPTDPSATTGGPNVVFDGTTSGTTFTPQTVLAPNQAYFWEVIGTTPGAAGQWSNIQGFTTSNDYTVDEWMSPVSGDWGDNSKWSLGYAPSFNNYVLIDQGGDYTITNANGDYSSARGIINSVPGATIDLTGGNMQFGNGTFLSEGQFVIDGGALVDATILPGGNGHDLTLTVNAGFIANVTIAAGAVIDGTHDNSGNNFTRVSFSAITLDGTIFVGSGSGVVSSNIYFQDTQDLAGTGKIIFGNSSNNEVLAIGDGSARPATLTLDSGITIRGGVGYIRGYFNGFAQGDNVINEGTVVSTAPNSSVTVSQFQNGPGGKYIAQVQANISFYGSFKNAGMIVADQSSFINFNGEFTLADLGDFEPNGAQIFENGQLDLLPVVPTALTATAGDGYNLLNWTDPSITQQGAEIWRSTDGTLFTNIATVAGAATTYIDPGRTPGQKYFYEVRGYDFGGVSPFSNMASATPVSTVQPGLLATYYLGDNFNTPFFTRIDSTVDFSLGHSMDDPDPIADNPFGGSIPEDNVSVKWIGTVTPKFSETYTFTTVSDDGANLFVDGQQLVNDFTDHNPITDTGTIALQAGVPYTIELDYFQGGGPYTIHLSWQSASQPMQIIPSTATIAATAALLPASPAGPSITFTAADSTLLVNSDFNWKLSGGTIVGGTIVSTDETVQVFNTLTLVQTVLLGTPDGLSTGTLEIDGDGLITGTGTLVLGGSPKDIIESVGDNYANPAIAVISSGITLSGGGELMGMRRGDTFDIQGTINANNPSTPIILLPDSAVVTDEGLIEATNGGTLKVTNLQINLGGTAAANGGTLELDGTAINVAGLISGTPGSTIVLAGDFTGLSLGNFQPNGATVNIPGEIDLTPLAPANLTVAPGNDYNILSWTDASVTPSSFLVLRSTDGVHFSQIGTVVPTDLNYIDGGLTSGTKYYYEVEASGVGGSSLPTNIANGTPTGAIPQGLLAFYYNGINFSSLIRTEIDPTINYSNFDGTLPPFPAGIPGSNFSVKWIGQIIPGFSETYTFRTESDDGVRVFVNGQEIINDFTFHGETLDSGTIALVAGVHYDIEMDYFQGPGGDIAQLSWASNSQPLQVVPASALRAAIDSSVTQGVNVAPVIAGPTGLIVTPGNTFNILDWTAAFTTSAGVQIFRSTDNMNFSQVGTLAVGVEVYYDTGLTPGTKYYYEVREYSEQGVTGFSNIANGTPTGVAPPSGILGTYFNTTNFYSTLVSQIDPGINYSDQGIAGSNPWPANIPTQFFSALWTGRFTAAFSETYTFTTISDDGIRLWVWPVGQARPATPLINDYMFQGPTTTSGSINLTGGITYDVEVQYYQGPSGHSAQLSWSSASTPMQVIPASAFTATVDSSFNPPGPAVFTVANPTTLTLNGGAASWNLTGGLINGGTIAGTAAAALNVVSGTLAGVAISSTGGVNVAPGHSLTITGGLANAGNLTVNGSATADSITGAGTTTVGGSLTAGTLTQALLANTGSVSITNSGVLGRISGAGALVIGTPVINATVQLSPGGGASTVSALTINTGSTLDITKNNSLYIKFTGGDPIGTIVGYLKSAYTAGSWTGAGLTSTSVKAQVASVKGTTNGSYSIGYSDGNKDGTVGGVVHNEILVSPELVADANFDGKVDFNDLLLLAQNNGSVTGDWVHADFNYDGKVDFNDLLLLAQNNNKTNGTTVLGAELPASSVISSGDSVLSSLAAPSPAASIVAAAPAAPAPAAAAPIASAPIVAASPLLASATSDDLISSTVLHKRRHFRL